MAQCQNAATFQKAFEICATNGGRLCTLAELEGECTESAQGCGGDSGLVWSSTFGRQYGEGNMRSSKCRIFPDQSPSAPKYARGVCMPSQKYSNNECCSGGYLAITSEGECQRAFNAMKQTYGNLASWGGLAPRETRPSGCFWNVATKQTYYNPTNVVGNTMEGDDNVICTAPPEKLVGVTHDEEACNNICVEAGEFSCVAWVRSQDGACHLLPKTDTPLVWDMSPGRVGGYPCSTNKI